jgi:hypothetical protein
MSDHFILEGRKAVPVGLLVWAKWFETADRVVAKTTTPNGDVSTVFIGSNHQFGEGPPLIFETMIFGGTHDQECWRCTTYDQAEDQHQRAIELTAT